MFQGTPNPIGGLNRCQWWGRREEGFPIIGHQTWNCPCKTRSNQSQTSANRPVPLGALAAQKPSLVRRKPSLKRRKRSLKKRAKRSSAIWKAAKRPRPLARRRRKFGLNSANAQRAETIGPRFFPRDTSSRQRRQPNRHPWERECPSFTLTSGNEALRKQKH